MNYKEHLLFKTRSQAFHLLQSTDWYVTRKFEDGTAIPAEVSAYRQEVKAVSGQRCTLIEACNDEAELEALIARPYWDIATQFDTLTNTYSGEGDATALQPWPVNTLLNYSL